MTTYDEPTEDEIHLARWLLGGFVLLSAAGALIPDDWDGIDYDAFKTQLEVEYATIIRNWLIEYHIPWMESRGMPYNVTSTQLNEVIRRTMADTTDLHRSMQESFGTGTFSQWGSPTHQGLILRDMARIAGDHLNEVVYQELKSFGVLTGNQRWRTASPDSRHAELNLQTTSTGVWRYKNTNITHPRHDPQNPNEWSGCSCYIEYEWRTDDATGWI